MAAVPRIDADPATRLMPLSTPDEARARRSRRSDRDR